MVLSQAKSQPSLTAMVLFLIPAYQKQVVRVLRPQEISNGGEAGLVTAAEWNDLHNWDFWNDLINGQDYSKMPDYWGFYTNNRLSFQVSNNSKSANNALIELQMQGNTVWSARTDNFGKAELWIGLYEESSEVNLGAYDVLVNGNPIAIDLKDFSEGG